MKTVQRKARHLTASLVAVLALVVGSLVFAGSASAYAPTATVANTTPAKCSTDSIHILNFPKKSPVTVYVANYKGKLFTIGSGRTTSKGNALIAFRIPCTSLESGYHSVGAVAKPSGARVYATIKVLPRA